MSVDSTHRFLGEWPVGKAIRSLLSKGRIVLKRKLSLLKQTKPHGWPHSQVRLLLLHLKLRTGEIFQMPWTLSYTMHAVSRMKIYANHDRQQCELFLIFDIL